MPDIVQLSKADLIAAYSWPFPPERGYIYDHDMLVHWLQDQVASVTVSQNAHNADADTRLRKSQWVALATSATIDRAITQQDVGVRLGDEHAKAVLATNESDLEDFITGLVTSPPTFDVVPFPSGRRIVVVIGGHVVVIPGPAPEPHPEWTDGESLSRADLLGAATRLQIAADASDSAALREGFLAGADRLFEVAGARA